MEFTFTKFQNATKNYEVFIKNLKTHVPSVISKTLTPDPKLETKNPNPYRSCWQFLTPFLIHLALITYLKIKKIKWPFWSPPNNPPIHPDTKVFQEFKKADQKFGFWNLNFVSWNTYKRKDHQVLSGSAFAVPFGG